MEDLLIARPRAKQARVDKALKEVNLAPDFVPWMCHLKQWFDETALIKNKEQMEKANNKRPRGRKVKAKSPSVVETSPRTPPNP